jgi:hypothetical protein
MRTPLAAAITLVSAAALVSGATLTAASASAGQAAHAGRASALAMSRRVRHENFRIITTSVDSRRQSVLATGAFTAGGYQVPGKLVNLRATDKMVFPGGTFQVARHVTRQWLPLPSASCLVRETIRGSYSLGHGTGVYRHVSGSGSFVTRIRGVIRSRHGKCGGPMTVFQEITYSGGTFRR